MWNFSIYLWVASYARPQMFAVHDGNDDWADLVKPEKYGLEHTQNIYLTSDGIGAGVLKPEEKIGVWWIRAPGGEVAPDEKPSDKYTKVLHNMPKLGSDDTVFILLHGNAKNRGASHRIAAYKRFQGQGYHTLTLDYRGWGDSVMAGGFDSIGEDSVVEDAKLAIRFVRREVGNEAKLVLYSHSMGTGIAPRAAVECSSDPDGRVDGIIMDSPFHSLRDMLVNMPYVSKVISSVMDIDKLLEAMKAWFDNPKWVSQFQAPVVIFVADSDPVTPPHLSEKLLTDVKASGKTDISLIRWTQGNLGHIGISTTKTFTLHVTNFVKSLHQEDNKQKSKEKSKL